MSTLKKLKTTELDEMTGFVAFLDILGFKELLKKSNHGAIIGDMVSTLRARVEYDEKHYTKLRYIAISDSVIITAEKGMGLALVRKIAQVQTALLKQGFAVRGAIAFGKILMYSGQMGRNIFGKTYLKAYAAEQGLALYPRVVADSDATATAIRQDIKDETVRRSSTYIRRDDHDEIWYVNQFSSQVIGSKAKFSSNRAKSAEERAAFARKISDGLKETANKPSANMKWRWLWGELNFQLPEDESVAKYQ